MWAEQMCLVCKAHSFYLGDIHSTVWWGGVSDLIRREPDWQPNNVLTVCVLKCLCSCGVCNQGIPTCWVQGTLV
jgi:hypothetical protein